MISDEELNNIIDSGSDCQMEIKEMAAELLKYREAERRAKSWDDAPTDAKFRVFRAASWIYYNADEVAFMEECGISTDHLEGRPK